MLFHSTPQSWPNDRRQMVALLIGEELSDRSIEDALNACPIRRWPGIGCGSKARGRWSLMDHLTFDAVLAVTANPNRRISRIRLRQNRTGLGHRI